MITRFDAGHSGTHFFHHAAAFMTKNRREDTLRVLSGKCECIGVAYTCGHHAHQDFAFFWALNIDLCDLEWVSGLNRYSSA